MLRCEEPEIIGGIYWRLPTETPLNPDEWSAHEAAEDGNTTLWTPPIACRILFWRGDGGRLSNDVFTRRWNFRAGDAFNTRMQVEPIRETSSC